MKLYILWINVHIYICLIYIIPLWPRVKMQGDIVQARLDCVSAKRIYISGKIGIPTFVSAK